jgi:hypothetical protein
VIAAFEQTANNVPSWLHCAIGDALGTIDGLPLIAAHVDVL